MPETLSYPGLENVEDPETRAIAERIARELAGIGASLHRPGKTTVGIRQEDSQGSKLERDERAKLSEAAFRADEALQQRIDREKGRARHDIRRAVTAHTQAVGYRSEVAMEPGFDHHERVVGEEFVANIRLPENHRSLPEPGEGEWIGLGQLKGLLRRFIRHCRLPHRFDADALATATRKNFQFKGGPEAHHIMPGTEIDIVFGGKPCTITIPSTTTYTSLRYVFGQHISQALEEAGIIEAFSDAI
jgi:hypothetical protein